MRFTTTETQDDVRIAVHATSLNDGRACIAVNYGATPFDITLDAPLGGRELIDEKTGTTRPVLDGSTVPTITELPDGYRERDIGHGIQDGVEGYFRTWSPSVKRELYPAVHLFVTTSDLPRRRDGRTEVIDERQVTITTRSPSPQPTRRPSSPSAARPRAGPRLRLVEAEAAPEAAA